MKIASYVHGGVKSYGLVTAGGIVDLGRRLNLPDAKALLAAGVSMARPFLSEPADVRLDEVALEPPIPNPLHILGIGLNTRSHFEETAQLMNRTPGDFPPKPRLFFRSPLSLVGPGAEILVPKVSQKLDYEGEIVAVIGRAGRYIAREDALSHIAGFACGNDGSVRDYQIHSNQVTAGKNFFASGSWGPWLVTTDEAGDPDALRLETRINGELRQQLTIGDFIFSFAELVSYISEVIPLQPGDAIFTGSPAGIGALAGRWLKPGDLVEVSSPQLGALENIINAES